MASSSRRAPCSADAAVAMALSLTGAPSQLLSQALAAQHGHHLFCGHTLGKATDVKASTQHIDSEMLSLCIIAEM